MAKTSKPLIKGKSKGGGGHGDKPPVRKITVTFEGENINLYETIRARAALETRPLGHQILHELKAAIGEITWNSH